MNFPFFSPSPPLTCPPPPTAPWWDWLSQLAKEEMGRENKSCLLLLRLGVRGMSELCMEGSGWCVTSLLLFHTCMSSLAELNDDTKLSLSWENHYFYEVLLTVSEIVPVMEEHLRQKCSCYLGRLSFTCALFWAVVPKISKGFNYKNELSLKTPCGAMNVKTLYWQAWLLMLPLQNCFLL